MKVYEIINERVSSVLFHVIDFRGAKSMLEQNKLRQQEVSFARSLTGEYHLGNKMIGVIFQFDGDLLNRQYRGAPVGTEDWDLEDNLTYRGKENKQQEDRLKTKEGLPEVTKYIKAAIVFCPKEFVKNSHEDEFGEVYSSSVEYIASVTQLLTAKKIPFRYVSTVKELFNKNVNNKQGFLEAVAMVDEPTASKLGLKITKKYTAVLELVVNVGDGEEPEWEVYDSKQIHITAASRKKAEQKATAIADKKTKEHEKLGRDGMWEFVELDEFD